MAAPRHGARPREDQRDKLERRWKKNSERRKADRPASPDAPSKAALGITHTFDADGNQVTIERRGAEALAERQAMNDRLAELCAKVQNWNRRRGKGGKVQDVVKNLSGEVVMEILEIAGALTNDPAYEATRKAMILHRLDTGGLRSAFGKLLRRHGHDQGTPDHLYADDIEALIGQQLHAIDDDVYENDEGESSDLQAVEYVVAMFGIEGETFDSVVARVHKAYKERGQHEARRQQYLNELLEVRTK
jgi:hypothetical protein